MEAEASAGAAGYAPLPKESGAAAAEEGQREAAPAAAGPPAGDNTGGGPKLEKGEAPLAEEQGRCEPVPAAAFLSQWCTQFSGALCPRCMQLFALLWICANILILGWALVYAPLRGEKPLEHSWVLVAVPRSLVFLCCTGCLMRMHALYSSAAYSELLQSAGRSRGAPTSLWQLPAALLLSGALNGLQRFLAFCSGALSLQRVLGFVLAEFLSVVSTTALLPLCIYIELAIERVLALRKMISTSDWQDQLVFESLYSQYERLGDRMHEISQAVYRAALLVLAEVSISMVWQAFELWIEFKRTGGPYLDSPFYTLARLAILGAGASVAYQCDELADAALRRMPRCSEGPSAASAGAGILQFVHLVRDRPIGLLLLPGWPSVNHLRLGPMLLWKAASPLVTSGGVWCLKNIYVEFEKYCTSESEELSPIFLSVFYGTSLILLIMSIGVLWVTSE